ncbi:MAG TPA: SsrA-binding protein SmpB [Atribacteraceae bacterium]|nr:SsrA-binding protein SmpB [Atribacteraceae bacterium]
MKVVSQNRKARHLYEIEDTLEVGIELQGTEVKALRNHMVNLTDAYARSEKGEMWLFNLQISPYDFGSVYNHDPKRTRRLLMHKKEIVRWSAKADQKGMTIVPLRVYFSDKNRAKVEIALVKPRKLYDRRREIQKKEMNRELERVKKKRFES